MSVGLQGRVLAVMLAGLMVGFGAHSASGQSLFGTQLHGTTPDSTPAPGATPPPLPGRDMPPPLPQAEESAFFVDNQGRPEGPLTSKQIIDRIQSGQITRSTLVWKRGTPNWRRAEEVGELRQAFAAAPPAMPQESRFERYMVGTWEGQSQQQGMLVQSAIRFGADGNFSGVQRVQMIGGGGVPPVTMPVSGRWTVQAISEARFVLTLMPSDNSPPVSGTYEVMDDSTMRHEELNAVARRVAG